MHSVHMHYGRVLVSVCVCVRVRDPCFSIIVIVCMMR